MSTVANEPIVPPPLPSFRLESAKDCIAGSGESAADVEVNVGARIDRSAVAIIDKGKNGICGEISTTTTGRDEISALPPMWPPSLFRIWKFAGPCQ